MKIQTKFPSMLKFVCFNNFMNFCRFCYECGIVFKDPQIGHLFAKIGAHFISKNWDSETPSISRAYILLTQCRLFQEMKIHYETLQWNCQNFQMKLQNPDSSIEHLNSTERKCFYCSKKYFLSELLTDEVAEILHIMIDHSDIQTNGSIFRCLVNSHASTQFPFLDTCFEDIIDKTPKNRRFRCSKCLVIFEKFEDLLVHAKLHSDLLQM